jgi:hypothetical protein
MAAQPLFVVWSPKQNAHATFWADYAMFPLISEGFLMSTVCASQLEWFAPVLVFAY